MTSTARQIQVMIRANILSLSRRLAISLSMVLSIALVVGVLAGFLGMAKGFERALAGAGSPNVAVVLGGGTNQETSSDLPAASIRSIIGLGADVGAIGDGSDNLVYSREIVVPTEIEGRTLALRGMDPTGATIRDNAKLSAGRLFTSGTREIVVGERLARDFPIFSLGGTVRLGTIKWTVVGYFANNGGAFESEIWADLDAVRAGFGRQGQVQTLRLRLENPASIARLKDALAKVTGTPLVVVSEEGLYATQSQHTSDIIRLFGWPIALLMALGAIAGALNTMMTSVSDRKVEVATVRALGFGRLPTFIATWFEAVFLSAAGSFVGVTLSWIIFNGWQASTIGANNARTGFELAITPDVIISASLLGLAVGVIGGVPPAFTASRLPLILALRSKS